MRNPPSFCALLSKRRRRTLVATLLIFVPVQKFILYSSSVWAFANNWISISLASPWIGDDDDGDNDDDEDVVDDDDEDEC